MPYIPYKQFMRKSAVAVLTPEAMQAAMQPPPQDPGMMGGQPPMDPSMQGGMMPPGGAPPMDPAMMGGAPMPPQGAPMDPAMMGGQPPMDPSMMGGAPQTGMINMTADEFTKFVKQMMAAFGQGGAAPAQQSQSDLSAKLDTLIAVIQGKATQPAVQAAPAAQAPLVAGA